MSVATESARKSRLASASHRLGVLAVLLLLVAGCCILSLVLDARAGGSGSLNSDDVRMFSWGAVLGQGLAAVAALAAFILGIFALGDIRRGAGKVEGRGQAVSGLVTATLTLLPLVLVHGVAPLVVAILFAGKEEKAASSNNLKELGIAMQMYHDTYGCLPPAVLHDPRLGDRAQPYSWRVALLPFLGEHELFHQYHRDEPWDSPANTAVLGHMPRVFARPGSRRGADDLTYYQVLVGPGTAFERPDLRIRLADFPRGAEQTILVVEAADPVPWTKPVDLPYAADGPMPRVGGLVGNGFHALFADGDVRWFEPEQRENELRTHVPLK